MPLAPTAPGVHIVEAGSGVRTITGVSTSVTAFVGRALAGPVDQPVTVGSFAEYERAFGGLSASYPLSYAVRAFFLNGGGQAVVVRVFAPSGNDSGVATLTVGGLRLDALAPGAWGNGITASVDRDGITADVAQSAGLPPEQLFNLVVTSGATVERYANVSVTEGPRRVDRLLAAQSQLVRAPALPSDNPATAAAGSHEVLPVRAAGGDDGASSAGAPVLIGSPDARTGLYALDHTDLFNLLCIPPDAPDGDVPVEVYQAALGYCVGRRAVLLVDPPVDWDPLRSDPAAFLGSFTGTDARNAALYYPRLMQPDPLRANTSMSLPASAAVAGVIARTDAQRGIWKAPAGVDAGVSGVTGIATRLTDTDTGRLNPLGVNCLRSFPVTGVVVWGTRTLRGADQLADEYKYLPVRRLALYLEESLYRGSQWAVFEPNDAPLWSQLRLNVGTFLQGLFRQGAFAGRTPQEAYYVACGPDTTTPGDIAAGVVNVTVGFAPLVPAEFVVITIRQSAGQPA